MKIEKSYNRIVVLNEDCIGDRARKLADLIYAVYGESGYEDFASMDILAAAEIALGEKGDLTPKDGAVAPELVVVPERASDLEVFASGDPDWVTWEWAIAVVDAKIVQLQAAQPEAVSPLLPSELRLLAWRLAGCLQDWGEYDEDEDEDEDEDSDFEDEDDSDEDSDFEDEDDSDEDSDSEDEDNDPEEEVVSL